MMHMMNIDINGILPIDWKMHKSHPHCPSSKNTRTPTTTTSATENCNDVIRKDDI